MSSIFRPIRVESISIADKQITVNKFGTSYQVIFNKCANHYATIYCRNRQQIDAAIKHFLATGQVDDQNGVWMA